MKIIEEFKAFASRGNVVDMAVGIIIGASFGNIVTSLVNDILMPPIGMLIGGVDFGNLSFTVKEAIEGTPAIVIKYGAFINTIIDFLIVAFAIFMVVKFMNSIKKKEEAQPSAPQSPSEEVQLLSQIRDLLKSSK